MQVAEENQCDFLLLGYKVGDDPLENSVIHRVVARQPCDIAILNSNSEDTPDFRRILIPIGGREIHDRLKARIVHSLGTNPATQFTFLTVISPEVGQSDRKKAEDNLKRAATIYQLPRANLIVEESSQTANAIVEHAKNHDLLIIGVRDESWFQSFFFGTLPQQITGQVQCPTLLVKATAGQKSKVNRWFSQLR